MIESCRNNSSNDDNDDNDGNNDDDYLANVGNNDNNDVDDNDDTGRICALYCSISISWEMTLIVLLLLSPFFNVSNLSINSFEPSTILYS